MASEKTAPNIRTRSGAVRKRSMIAMNIAFAALRAQIPNLPPDTNLSKIRTFRLAIRYIKFLMEILEERDQEMISNSFEPDLPEEENTESSVSLITGHLLKKNICETLLTSTASPTTFIIFGYFYISTESGFRTKADKRQSKYQMAPAYLGKRIKGV